MSTNHIVLRGIFALVLSHQACHANAPPTASRQSPSSPITLLRGASQTFTVRGNDPDCNLRGAEWYLDGVHQVSHFTLSGCSGTDPWTYTFNTARSTPYIIEALVFDTDSPNLYSSPARWELTVENRPPTASRATPRVAVLTLPSRITHRFQVNASDIDCDLRGVEWYLDGVHQAPSHFTLSGCSGVDSWDHSFEAARSIPYQVEAVVFDAGSPNLYSSPVAWDVTVVRQRRGIYVDCFSAILGNQDDERNLLAFAMDRDVDYLAVYGPPVGSPDESLLETFMGMAKQEYGINEIGASFGSEPAFDNVISFNDRHAEKFDVLNLEYEYWNNDPKDFERFKAILEHMRAVSQPTGLRVEAYIGWPASEKEAREIADRVDRLLVHAYRNSPVDTYDYTRTRLSWFARPERPLDVSPIFSAEDGFMGPWLATHPMSEAESLYSASFEAEAGEWRYGVALLGFQYFTYTGFPGAATPVVRITNPTRAPTYATAAGTVDLAGIACRHQSEVHSSGAMQEIEWANDRDGSGSCDWSPTSGSVVSWSRSALPLVAALNVLTVQTTDVGGVAGADTLIVKPMSAFVNCLTGPARPPQPLPPMTLAECLEAFDVDLDGDVDLHDYGAFLGLFRP